MTTAREGHTKGLLTENLCFVEFLTNELLYNRKALGLNKRAEDYFKKNKPPKRVLISTGVYRHTPTSHPRHQTNL